MLEEFHGIKHEDATYTFKLLYGWNRLNANVWLPSLSELIGITGTQSTGTGCYYSAMQGLNTSGYWYTDAQGGTQFSYLKQYNANGGGQRIWDACNQQISWFRSPHCGWSVSAWSIENATTFNASGGNVVTLSRAIHPAV